MFTICTLISILLVIFEIQRFLYIQILRVLLFFFEITGMPSIYTYTQVISVFMQVSCLIFLIL